MAHLHPQIVNFFLNRMNEHSCVAGYNRLPNSDEYLYEIRRKNELRIVIVHLSDAYLYSKAEFAARPKEIGIGDFIVVARPEASLEDTVVQLGNKMAIPVGRISKLMGALNCPNIWEYHAPGEGAPSPEITLSALINTKRWKRHSS